MQECSRLIAAAAVAHRRRDARLSRRQISEHDDVAVCHLVFRVNRHCKCFNRREIEQVDFAKVAIRVVQAADRCLEHEIRNQQQRREDTNEGKVNGWTVDHQSAATEALAK